MRGILINPFDQTVTEVDVEDDLKAWYKLMDCECVCSVRLDQRNVLWLDDNGLMGDQSKQRHFFMGAYPQMLAGKGLILALGPYGDSVSTRLGVEHVKFNVKWVKPELAPALMPPLQPTVYELDEDLNIVKATGPWADEGKED